MKSSSLKSDYVSRQAVLINGDMVLFRLLQKPDEAAVRSFFAQAPDRETETLRDDVRNPEVISSWIAGLDYQRVLPLLAWNEAGENIAGVATLHFMRGVYQHIADIRIFVGTAYRKLGLGSAMIKELIQIANQLELHFLRAEILKQNELAIKAFRQLGFEVKCSLEKYFMTGNGKTHDVVLLMKRLQAEMEEDLFYLF